MRKFRLTYIDWGEEPVMSVADLWTTSKKFKDYVDDYNLTQTILRQTDELERDIVRLEHLIYSIQNKIYAF